MTKFSYLRPSDLRDHFGSLVQDGVYDLWCETGDREPDVWGWFVIRVEAAVELARRVVAMVTCDLCGHDYQSVGCDPENGGETLACDRCGHHIDIWF